MGASARNKDQSVGRPCTGGQLYWSKRKGSWSCRMTLWENGERRRKMVELGRDRQAALLKRERLLNESREGYDSEVAEVSSCHKTVAQAVDEAYPLWCNEGREGARARMSLLRRYVFPHIGEMDVSKVRGSDITRVLFAARDLGRAKQTVLHIRNAMSRVFDELWRDEVIRENPVKRSRTPKSTEVKKRRAVLTDEEFEALIASEHTDGEIKIMGLVSRTIGGMRTGDLNALGWAAFDAPEFRSCDVPRKKTMAPQRIDVPDTVRPFLQAWWREHGRPVRGPVFPVRTGPRAGQWKSQNNSYAKRLRRDLKRALGVMWFDGRRWVEKPQAEYTQRERVLFTETETTLPVDFHSCRRAYATALAKAGVNVQTAQVLTGHRSPQVHQRYVALGKTETPEAALPQGLQPIWAESVPKFEARSRSRKRQVSEIVGRRNRDRTCDQRLVRPTLYH